MGAACNKQQVIATENSINGGTASSSSSLPNKSSERSDTPQPTHPSVPEHPSENGDVLAPVAEEENGEPDAPAEASPSEADQPEPEPGPSGVQLTEDEIEKQQLDTNPELQIEDMSAERPATLVYYEGLRGRAEAARLLMKCVRAEYEERLLPVEEFRDANDKTTMPILEISPGVSLAGGRTIARYLAREHCLAFESMWQNAQVDMIVDAVEEFRDSLKPLVVDGQEKGRELWPIMRREKVEPFIEMLANILKQTESGWFVGSSLSWGDLIIFDVLVTLRDVWDKNVLDKNENLEQFILKIKAIPSIDEYLESRPYCMY